MTDERDYVQLTGTLDIECADWIHFVVACTYEPACGAKIHRSLDDLLDYLKSRGGHWWAHCGGRYDFLAIVELLRKRRWSAQIDYHARIGCGRVVSSGFTLRDSFALIPMGLDKAAPIAGLTAPELPWPCTCGSGCGGYCRISIAARDGEPELEDYCARDCYVLYQVINAVKEHASACGLALRGTIGSTAWATAKRDLRLDDIEYPWQTWERIGEASYGGRDLITRPQTSKYVAHYDISSAYGAALAKSSLPIGAPAELGGRSAYLALQNDSPGLYECSVYVPEDTFIPPLPVRLDGGRIVYPVGLIRGTWALPELLAAIERGCELQQIHSAVVWEDEAVLFDDLVAKWVKVRRKVGKRSALGEWMRLLVNSLTGKFSEQPLRTSVRLHPEEIRVCERKGRCRHRCTRRCGAFEQLDAWGHVWGQPFFRLGGNSHGEWSAYLRARCRVQLLEGIERSGEREHVYSKTDSIWSTSNRTPGVVGSQLGAWELQDGGWEWECRAPGTYCYRSGESGAYVIKAAGAGKLTYEEWRAGKVRRKDGARALLSAAQQGRSLFERNDYTFTLPGHDREEISWFGDRLLGGDGLTYPQPLEVHHARRDRERRKRREPED